MSAFKFELDPFVNFQALMKQAEAVIQKDPNAMSLATVSPDGVPSVRTVLFKGLIRDGFSFYTNYQSQKAQEIESHPQVSLLFFWNVLEQQVRISGKAVKLERFESEAYFRTRPRISQIGAWASQQSSLIAGPEELAKKVSEIEVKFKDQDIPCPPHWGGYHVIPYTIEFWFGQSGRLHDRFIYSRQRQTDSWQRSMKSP